MTLRRRQFVRYSLVHGGCLNVKEPLDYACSRYRDSEFGLRTSTKTKGVYILLLSSKVTYYISIARGILHSVIHACSNTNTI